MSHVAILKYRKIYSSNLGADPPTIKENKHSRIQGKSSNLQNFPCQECKQKKNRLTPVKLVNTRTEVFNTRRFRTTSRLY